MSTADMPTGNFQEIPLFHPYKDNPTRGEFGAISYFQRMGIPERDYLKSIQPDDYAQYNYTVAQKMNLLVEPPPATTPMRVYWSKVGGEWSSPYFVEMSFGTLVFGGQKLQVEMDGDKPKEYSLFGKYRARPTSEWIPFFKLIGMRKNEISRPVSELFAEGKIQKFTAANKGAGGQEDIYNDHPRGVMYSPVWSPLDWKVNSGVADALYIARKFLEEF
jgi:hypothetical protein